jgi:hypothetical protein
VIRAIPIEDTLLATIHRELRQHLSKKAEEQIDDVLRAVKLKILADTRNWIQGLELSQYLSLSADGSEIHIKFKRN